MTTRAVHKLLVAVGTIAVAVGLVAIGRLTAGTVAAHDAGYAQGRTSGYADGLQAGELMGMAEGRALQEGAALPAKAQQPAREAFAAGYDAGAADVFAGYDGGWLLSTPYVVTLTRGTTGIPYRITSRTRLEPGTTYRVCPGATAVCAVRSG